jgi:hypothetical protein
MISVKDNIIDAVQYGLQSITTASGYNNTVVNAYSPPIELSAIQGTPSINIYEGTDICSNTVKPGAHTQTGGNQAKLFNSFILDLQCVMNVVDSPRKARNGFIADVQKYFGLHWNVPDVNGIPTAFNCMYHSSTPWGQLANSPQFGFDIWFQVWYTQYLTDPTRQ